MKKEITVSYTHIKPPLKDCTCEPIVLNDETLQLRLEKTLKQLKLRNLDALIIYGDVEHGSNFEYLTGFIPRFEEALLVLHSNGEAYMLMGNENLNKVVHARIKATAIHVPYFSLPNQPMDNDKQLKEYFIEADIKDNDKVGIVGWKNFTSKFANNQTLFDVPYYILEAIKEITSHVINATEIFIGQNGVRTINNVNEIEYYEFGASLASDCMLEAMDILDVGTSELALGSALDIYGQHHSVVTIAATGNRFEKAYLYPKNKAVTLGDKISLTVGYRGGLSSRAGYAVHEETELQDKSDYLDVVVKPYYKAIVAWLENIHCDMPAIDLYNLIEEVLPKEKYHWHLCPGHLTAEEEWLSSPIYEGTKEILKSGMIFQTDIIPSIPGYGGTSVESTIVLADKQLRDEIKEKSPQLWKRFELRREYIINELNIALSEDVLPMCSTLAYLRPFMLNKNKAMKKD